MLVDARRLDPSSEIRTDVCIVGAGAAGISLALELRGSGLDVCVVESGGQTPSSRVERLKELRHCGAYALRQESWRRFGGATTQWGGNSAPYDAEEFSHLQWAAGTTWPISREEFERVHPRVQAFLGLDSVGYAPTAWRQASRDVRERWIALEEHDVRAKLYQHRLVDFAKRYGVELETRAPDVRVLLHATVLRLSANASGNCVERVEVGCLEGTRFALRARAVVLAAGIQNARLLLLSDWPDPRGLGNQHDNVGRYFITHLNFFSGILAGVSPRRDLSLYGLPEDLGEHEVRHTRVFAGFQIDSARREREQLLGYVAWVAPLSPPVVARAPQLLVEAAAAGVPAPQAAGRARELAEKAAGRILGHRARRRFPRRATAYAIHNWVEQAPERENRIGLAPERDDFGLPMLQSFWRIHAAEKRTIIRSQAILAHALARAGVGQLVVNLPAAADLWPASLAENSHYMGSTRMSVDPREGVVDSQCRVHGISNLYVAGGSVLPRAGTMMVTFNLLTLALRLGQHLKDALR
jgi:choline dehydrogenase-like flavoprotein